jgi:hypothetical protein
MCENIMSATAFKINASHTTCYVVYYIKILRFDRAVWPALEALRLEQNKLFSEILDEICERSAMSETTYGQTDSSAIWDSVEAFYYICRLLLSSKWELVKASHRPEQDLSETVGQ